MGAIMHMLLQLISINWLNGIIWKSFLLGVCKAAPQCPNGTVEAENATAIIDLINQARRRLADGLQSTVNGTLLPPAKNMNDLQWACDMEEVLVNATPNLCDGTDRDFYWLYFQPEFNESLPEYLTKEMLSEIETEAPTNITKEGVFYNDTVSYLDFYHLIDYLNLVRASTRKFACIIVSGHCNGFDPYSPLLYCGTDKPELVNGDIVYEIAEATTSVATTAEATTSVATTAKATTSVGTTAKATTNVATTITFLKSVATSSTTISPKHITQCAPASTTPSCITRSPKRVRREAKASLFEGFLMKKPAPAKRGGKTHRKKTLAARRTHAAKTATGKN